MYLLGGVSMERLTERRDDGSVVIATKCPEMCEYATCSMQEGYQCQHQCEGDIMQRLASYEDAEEQGLLLRLPCKVGDTIYNPVFGYYKGGELIKEPYVIEAVVTRFGFVGDELTIIAKNGIELREFYVDSIGKKIFLTKEEAEQKLADMGV